MPNQCDEQLVIEYRNGNQTAFEKLLANYQPVISNLSKKYFAPGVQLEDLRQEGAIGLYNAVRYYRVGGGSSFKAYAKVHIHSNLVNYLNWANRKKHKFLNESFSMDFEPPNGKKMTDFLPSLTPTPEEIVIRKEEDMNRQLHFNRMVSSMSNTEKIVFFQYMKGHSYKEISQIINVGTKTIDNALQRIKVKINRISGN